MFHDDFKDQALNIRMNGHGLIPNFNKHNINKKKIDEKD